MLVAPESNQVLSRREAFRLVLCCARVQVQVYCLYYKVSHRLDQIVVDLNDHVTAMIPRPNKVGSSSSSSSAVSFVWNDHHDRPVHPGLSTQPVALRDKAIQATEMTSFGDFGTLCRNIPSYPWCNLFYREVLSPSLHSSFIHSIYL